MEIPSKVRYFNKKYTNRLMKQIAGRRCSPIALIRHIGRKTGKLYETPILAAKSSDHFIFALTYGKEVDWYRNILANASAELLLRGHWFHLVNPRLLDAEAGRSAFASSAKTLLKLIKIQYYFQMEIEPTKD